jgi:hypothetical protein
LIIAAVLQNAGAAANSQFLLDNLVSVGDNGVEIGTAAPYGIAIIQDRLSEKAGVATLTPAKSRNTDSDTVGCLSVSSSSLA